jgi:hypothetical protein
MRIMILKKNILLAFCFALLSNCLYGQLDSLERKLGLFLEKNVSNKEQIIEYAGSKKGLVEVLSLYECVEGGLLVKSRVTRSNYFLFTYVTHDSISLIGHGFYNTFNLWEETSLTISLFQNSDFRRALISAVFGLSDHSLYVHNRYEVVLSGKVSEGKALLYRFSDGGIDVNDEGEWKEVNLIFYGVHATRDGVAPKFK